MKEPPIATAELSVATVMERTRESSTWGAKLVTLFVLRSTAPARCRAEELIWVKEPAMYSVEPSGETSRSITIPLADAPSGLRLPAASTAATR